MYKVQRKIKETRALIEARVYTARAVRFPNKDGACEEFAVRSPS